MEVKEWVNKFVAVNHRDRLFFVLGKVLLEPGFYVGVLVVISCRSHKEGHVWLTADLLDLMSAIFSSLHEWPTINTEV